MVAVAVVSGTSGEQEMIGSPARWGCRWMLRVWVVVEKVDIAVLGGEHQFQLGRVDSNVMTLSMLGDGLVDILHSALKVKHCDVESVVVVCHHHLIQRIDGNSNREVCDAVVSNFLKELCIIIKNLNAVSSVVTDVDLAILGGDIIREFKVFS